MKKYTEQNSDLNFRWDITEEKNKHEDIKDLIQNERHI